MPKNSFQHKLACIKHELTEFYCLPSLKLYQASKGARKDGRYLISQLKQPGADLLFLQGGEPHSSFTTGPTDKKPLHHPQACLMHVVNWEAFDQVNGKLDEWSIAIVMLRLNLAPKWSICAQGEVFCGLICYFAKPFTFLVTFITAIVSGAQLCASCEGFCRSITHNTENIDGEISLPVLKATRQQIFKVC